jgi:hypothetical protein
VEERFYKKTSQYSKFEFFFPESWAFALVFVRETTQSLTAKHWLSSLKGKQRVTKKKIQICCRVKFFYKAVLPLSHL